MAKCRIGQFVAAQILHQLGVECIDESEVITATDEGKHVNEINSRCPLSAAAAILARPCAALPRAPA